MNTCNPTLQRKTIADAMRQAYAAGLNDTQHIQRTLRDMNRAMDLVVASLPKIEKKPKAK